MPVGHGRVPLSIGDKIFRSGYGHDGGCIEGEFSGHQTCLCQTGSGIHAFGVGLGPGYGQQFGGIGADHVGLYLPYQLPGGFGPQPGGSRAYRIEHNRDAPPPRRSTGQEHGLDPGIGQSTDIDHQGIRDTHHLLHLITGMCHDRRCTHGQQDIGRKMHDHIIGDVVDQGVFCPYGFQHISGLGGNRVHLQSPMPATLCYYLGRGRFRRRIFS